MLKSILIIDDSEEDQYILKRTLTSANLADHIFQKMDGKEGFDFLETLAEGESLGDRFPPQLIFLDINMPFMDGFAFLEKFSKLKEKFDLLKPVVIMMFSSAELQKNKDRAYAYPFVKDYIVKHPTKEELKAVIKKHFD